MATAPLTETATPIHLTSLLDREACKEEALHDVAQLAEEVCGMPTEVASLLDEQTAPDEGPTYDPDLVVIIPPLADVREIDNLSPPRLYRFELDDPDQPRAAFSVVDHRGLDCPAEMLAALARQSLRHVEAQRAQCELARLKHSLGGIVHELAQPLMSARGYQEILLDGEVGQLNCDQAKLLSVAKRETERVWELIEDIRFLMRSGAAPMPLKLRDVSLSALVDEAVQAVAPMIVAKEQRVVVKKTDEARLEGDPRLLRRLLDNLVGNAAKYTPTRGMIEISLQSEPDELTLTVRDNGPGIKADDLVRVFERFYRADSTSAIPGSGLGLSLCQEIVDAHHGQIGARSAEGLGTSLTVRLPRQQPK